MLSESEHSVATAAAVNGASAEGAAAVLDTIPHTGPRIPKRIDWVDLPQEYAGFRARIWINYPQRLVGEITSGDTSRMTAALAQIVLEHNGWLDDEGQPFPPPTTQAFWEAIPTELAAVLMALINAEASRLPNSLTARPRR